MKLRCNLPILALLCASLTVTSATATSQTNVPSTSASAVILIEGDSGRVLYQDNATEQRAIASITKLMTALVAVESFGDLSQRVEIVVEDTLTEGSSLYLRAGEELTMETLLYGLLLHSGNDAALAIARICGGTVETFVDWMNQRAESLGMENSHFSNPNGLSDDDHYASAEDMAKLAVAVYNNETLRTIVATQTITLEGRVLENHNKLLWQYEGCCGMKTGYTQLAGRTLVSCAEREGQLLICVTLNDSDDWADHAALYDYGFATYQTQTLTTAGEQVVTLPVDGSLVNYVPLTAARTLTYPVQGGEEIRQELEVNPRVEAPVTQGTIAGSVAYYLGEELVGETYLLYGQSVERNVFVQVSVWERMLAFFQLRIEN